MPKRVKFEGNTYTVPDDATDDEISSILQQHAPSAPPAGPSVPTLTNQAPKEGFASALGSDLMGMAKGLPDMAARVFLPGYQQYKDIQHSQDQMRSLQQTGQTPEQAAITLRRAAGYGPVYSNVTAPLAEGIGVNVPGMEKAAAQGDVGGVLGHAAAVPTAMAITAGISKGISKAPTPTELFEQMRPKGPQSLMYPKAAALPPQVVNATEDIFRAAAPTNTNIKFRDSLYTAAPDLAEVARKVNLDEMKGGIINPDMRVNATVKAIDAHLADMYKTEREPQIEPYKNQTVPTKLDFDAKNGLRYLVKNAGQVGDRFLAAKALNGDPMTAGGLNRLAIVTNEELTPLRSMTPQERMAAQLTNKKLSGLQSLDKGLSNNLNDFLQAQGEPGLRGYEQRYAALSDVRNGLRSRINATELERNIDLGIVGKGIKAVTGGKSGIASASQAAVADVNIGKKLQGAMQTLADSGLKPNRAIRQVSPTSIRQLPVQSQ